MSQVTFRLSEGPPVYFDKRILVARSEYFREMLAGDAWKEAKSGEVDLSKNPHMNHRNLQAILQFLCDGTFSSDADTAKALAVRCIADEYRLTQLVVQAEKHLERLLSWDNALEFLGHVQGWTVHPLPATSVGASRNKS
ncbi:unnamed protein product [Symbiodinium pilosum]|uniref:BTB domain-containing protein n=1 Tax=Symbiodinium pilosum TaxID=2952 RepID=A0A812XIN6_SYMPI|nr:unnamed protein product [Symbiodinium pilosum]